jgi:hypothetical protein
MLAAAGFVASAIEEGHAAAADHRAAIANSKTANAVKAVIILLQAGNEQAKALTFCQKTNGV